MLKIYYCLDAMKPNSVNNELVETLSCIGHAQNWEGKFDEAAKTYKKALSLLEDTFCDKNIKMIADLYDNLAVVYDSQELYTECVDALSKALLFYKKYTEQGGNCQEKIDEIINIFTTNNIQIPTL
ncbi:MAG: tetratricopeptide repeat protein [Paludibacteraceae bacterium]|nr:tetratricopeptide repeat protein [Paludibacteraceae bacterium]